MHYLSEVIYLFYKKFVLVLLAQIKKKNKNKNNEWPLPTLLDLLHHDPCWPSQQLYAHASMLLIRE